MPFTDMLKPITDRLAVLNEAVVTLAQANKINSTLIDKLHKRQKSTTVLLLVWPVIVAILFKWVF